jgi:IS1 family transposase
VDKDTVAEWLDTASKHVEAVSRYLMVNLHFEEAQLDEFWSFVQKKEARCTAFERLQTEYGDCWVWMSFDPVHKVIPAFVVGEINQENADRLIAQTQAVNDGSLHVFFSDQRPQYREAILKAFGQWMQPERQGQRGRRPKPRLVPPPDLLYAQVGEASAQGSGRESHHGSGFWHAGSAGAYLKRSPASRRVNTAFVERQNNTMRQHNRRFTRKTLGFSKKRYWMERQLHLCVGYYHFCLPHSGLREEIDPPLPTKGNGSPKKWREVTPDDGGGSDGSRMDSARVADVSGTTPGSRKYCVN